MGQSLRRPPKYAQKWPIGGVSTQKECLFHLGYIKEWGNLSLRSVKGPKRAHFIAVKKTRKLSGFVIYSHSKDGAFAAVKRETAFYTSI